MFVIFQPQIFCLNSKLLNYFEIPHVIITDGDYSLECTGIDRMQNLVERLYPKDFEKIVDWGNYFKSRGIFIGKETLEIDILEACHEVFKQLIIDVFTKVTSGGKKHQENFAENFAKKDFNACYSAIASCYVGKANFMQELALTDIDVKAIPNYISTAIKTIGDEV